MPFFFFEGKKGKNQLKTRIEDRSDVTEARNASSSAVLSEKAERNAMNK